MSKSKYLTFAVMIALLGCDDSDDDKKSGSKNSTADSGTSSNHRDSGSSRSDAGSDDDNGGNDDVGGGESSGGSNDHGDVGGGESGGGNGSGGSGSGGNLTNDAGGGAPVAIPDGGVTHGSGSCCAERDTPGCGDANLEVCVCEKDPTCCTSDWGKRCVFIVEQKYCQDGVRDCVCDQWGKSSCCDVDWTSTCDTVGVAHCSAVQGCF